VAQSYLSAEKKEMQLAKNEGGGGDSGARDIAACASKGVKCFSRGVGDAARMARQTLHRGGISAASRHYSIGGGSA